MFFSAVGLSFQTDAPSAQLFLAVYEDVSPFLLQHTIHRESREGRNHRLHCWLRPDHCQGQEWASVSGKWEWGLSVLLKTTHRKQPVEPVFCRIEYPIGLYLFCRRLLASTQDDGSHQALPDSTLDFLSRCTLLSANHDRGLPRLLRQSHAGSDDSKRLCFQL